MGDAFAGLVIANLAGAVIGAVILAATGNTGTDIELSLVMVAVLQIPLWSGYLGAPLYAAKYKGNGVVADFGLRMEPWDVLKGLGAGLVAQILAIPLLYFLLFSLTDALGWEFDHDISAAARELVEKATDPVGVVLLVLITVVGAPIIEELFFRGLLLRSIQNRFGPAAALWGSSLVFAAVHLQPLQFPALLLIGLVLGWLAQRSGRLGPSIWAHVAFNGVATLTLLTAEYLDKAGVVIEKAG
jgi:membrane protease YdiL (CAAX protease family)